MKILVRLIALAVFIVAVCINIFTPDIESAIWFLLMAL